MTLPKTHTKHISEVYHTNGISDFSTFQDIFYLMFRTDVVSWKMTRKTDILQSMVADIYSRMKNMLPELQLKFKFSPDSEHICCSNS